ncbi:hypothetical protein BKA63DRAFT_609250 [Paraphoma chrysanthemicola]|nr:hypothetical protein BKA63DRAFT_609250 [Paraphoma chrysanthemicola]
MQASLRPRVQSPKMDEFEQLFKVLERDIEDLTLGLPYLPNALAGRCAKRIVGEVRRLAYLEAAKEMKKLQETWTAKFTDLEVEHKKKQDLLQNLEASLDKVRAENNELQNELATKVLEFKHLTSNLDVLAAHIKRIEVMDKNREDAKAAKLQDADVTARSEDLHARITRLETMMADQIASTTALQSTADTTLAAVFTAGALNRAETDLLGDKVTCSFNPSS